jgi:type VI secretion system secreted protein Hcp
MAVDAFLKIDDIKGESADDKHAGEIDVLAWSWGANQSATTQTGSGGGTGKVTVHDLTITKQVDRSSPTLLGLCFSGTPIKQALLTQRKAGGKDALEYIKITMESAIVSSVSTSGSAGTEVMTENITLNFARVKLDYTPQKADGSGDAVVKFGFDIAKNKPWG